ncbi:g2193 [Coccomyxa viridis]|uniref:G2193 protein n=1 Tax=Coccomyxa viridis TaxID=1274662 RepID=A0ABP1FRP1_9CHLO
MDAQGNAVEWWVTIKPPSTRDLLYIDGSTSETDPTRWRFRAVSGDGTTPVQRTLQQLQSSSGGRAFGHVMYSDDAPQPDGAPAADSPDAAFTQGRGVLGFGASRGFWITHSMPSFPLPPDSADLAGIPSRAHPHAHSLLCISAAAGQLRGLAGTLQSNRYNVYSQALPSDTSLWSAEDLSAAAELLLQDPADSADGGDATEPDVIMNEISAIGGERFVVLGNNGSKSETDIVSSILGSFFGTSMLRTSQYWPRPCTASTSGFPNFQPRDLLEKASGLAWNASVERSQWQISFSEGRAPLKCQNGLWDPDEDAETGSALLAEPLGTDSDGDVLEQEKETISSGMRWELGAQHAAMFTHSDAEVAAGEGPSLTMTVPVTSTSRRLLLTMGDSERDPLDAPGRTLSEFITYGTDSVARPLTSLAKQLAHRLLGSPEMTAELAMRRSVLSAPGAAQAQPHSASSFFNWLPASVWPLFKIVRGGQPAGEEQALYQPQDDSYFSAASELLGLRNAAIKDGAALDRAHTVKQETEQGLAMELRLTGATSVVPWQAEEPEQATITSPQKTDGDEEEDCTAMVGVIEELKCRAHSLQQQGRALEKLVDRLEGSADGDSAEAERTAVEAARTEGPLFGYSLRQRWGYLDGQKQSKGESFGEDLLREGWEGAGMSQSGESAACARGAEGRLVPEEKHAVCFRDRGRSLEAGGLPGGAVCFGGHEGLWHALRALVRTYEYCA